jgi:hypothetical protein
VEVMGYKKIMNLPDYSKNGYRTIKLQTQEGSSGKFQPAAGCSPHGLHGRIMLSERILP